MHRHDMRKQPVTSIKSVTFSSAHPSIKFYNQDRMLDFVLIAIGEDDEAVFINIVGEADYRSIRKIDRKFDIDELEDLDEDELARERRK